MLIKAYTMGGISLEIHHNKLHVSSMLDGYRHWKDFQGYSVHEAVSIFCDETGIDFPSGALDEAGFDIETEDEDGN